MVKVNGIEFSTTIGVLFALKEARGLKTLQETYKIFDRADMDTIMEVLTISYNKQHKDASVTEEQFIELLEEKEIGFLKITDVFGEVVEALVFGGMSPEEVDSKKKLLMSQQKLAGINFLEKPSEQA